MSKRTATKSTMHPMQSAYALALAAYETAKEAAKAECVAKGFVHVRGESDEQFERTCNGIDDIEIAHGVWALSNKRADAEKAMVLWSLDICEAQQPQGKEVCAFMRARVGTMRPAEWRKCVDMAFRLAA